VGVLVLLIILERIVKLLTPALRWQMGLNAKMEQRYLEQQETANVIVLQLTLLANFARSKDYAILVPII